MVLLILLLLVLVLVLKGFPREVLVYGRAGGGGLGGDGDTALQDFPHFHQIR
jgi:hypothetical protein